MVCLNQTIAVEIVQREAPDSLAHCVELAVDVVVAPKVQPFQLGATLSITGRCGRGGGVWNQHGTYVPPPPINIAQIPMN
jgi:hypothetical protein